MHVLLCLPVEIGCTDGVKPDTVLEVHVASSLPSAQSITPSQTRLWFTHVWLLIQWKSCPPHVSGRTSQRYDTSFPVVITSPTTKFGRCIILFLTGREDKSVGKFKSSQPLAVIRYEFQEQILSRRHDVYCSVAAIFTNQFGCRTLSIVYIQIVIAAARYRKNVKELNLKKTKELKKLRLLKGKSINFLALCGAYEESGSTLNQLDSSLMTLPGGAWIRHVQSALLSYRWVLGVWLWMRPVELVRYPCPPQPWELPESENKSAKFVLLDSLFRSNLFRSRGGGAVGMSFRLASGRLDVRIPAVTDLSR